MKALIWIGCAFAYGIVVSILRAAGIVLGAIPTVLLSLALVFLPAPALCRLYDQRREKTESDCEETWPSPGAKLCGTPFVNAGEEIPGAAAAAEPMKKRRRTRLEVILAVACAVLAVTSAVLGYKLYEFKDLTVALVRENDRLLRENEEAAKSGTVGEDVVGYLEWKRERFGDLYYVASSDSEIFHSSDCDYVERIPERNRVYFENVSEAEESGKVPCSVCNP